MKFRRLANTAVALGVLLLFGLALWEVLPESREIVSLELRQGEAQSKLHRKIGYLPRLNVVYAASDGRIYGIEDHFLFVSDDGGSRFRRLGKLPKVDADILALLKDKIARLKLVRLLRKNPGPTNLLVLESGTILVFWDHIYRSTDGGYQFQPVFDFKGRGVFSPFAHSEGVTVGKDDTVYFGEYLATSRPHPVRILRGTNDGRDWQIAHTFDSGEIFHVHSIQYDPYRDLYWVCTGDHDSETGLLYTRDDFMTLHRLGGGSQDWRIVSLLVTPDYLYWASDNDRSGAGIFRWDFEFSRLEELGYIGKASYYSTMLRDGTMVLSTTYDPESPFARAANPDPTSDLWLSKDGLKWHKILSLPYEKKEMPWGASRAMMAFPGGAPLDVIFYTPMSTKVQKFTTQVISP